MPSRLSVEELVIDDSFVNYCLQGNEQDTIYWDNYLRDFPDQQKTVEEAKKMVILLTGSLRPVAGDFSNELLPLKKQFNVLKIMGYVAATTVAILITYFWFIYNSNTSGNIPVQSTSAEGPVVYITRAGSKQTISLPDGSTVYLNAASRLSLSEGFGKTNRTVVLAGEGGFDIVHNDKLPFTVSVAQYDVNVTGTFFNVKAYPGDKITETSLLRGQVDILIKDGFAKPLRMTLKPKQKFVLDIEDTNSGSIHDESAKEGQRLMTPHASIEVLSYNRDSLNLETAWIQNTLVIEEETFESLKEKLERWYNVRLIFKDEKVKKYGFTGTFRNENIAEVLKAFQDSYFFNYTIQGTDITISK